MPLLTEAIMKDLWLRLRELRSDVGRANLLQSYRALGDALVTLEAEANDALARQQEGRR